MTYMTMTTRHLTKNGLTIISHNLLRTSSEDWNEPTRLLNRIQGTALAEIFAEINILRADSATYNYQRALLMFDCMLRVINEPAIKSVLEFGTERFAELQEIFYGALASEKFNALSSAARITYACSFYRLFETLQGKFKVRLSSFKPNSNKNLPVEQATHFDNIKLDDDEITKLQPFLLKPKSGRDYNVLLGPMVPCLGLAFTRRFHNVLCTIAMAKAKDTGLRDFGTTFARFVKSNSLTDNPVTEAKLKDPTLLYELLVDFLMFHFKKKYRMEGSGQEGTLASLQKLWTRYEHHWHRLVKAGVVAAPRPSFPQGKRSLTNLNGVRHKRRKKCAAPALEVKTGCTSDSALKPEFEFEFENVTHKLLTPVPLHLSDEATTHLLFSQINKDFETIQNWLDSHLEHMWQQYQHGLELTGPGPFNLASDENIADLLNPKKNPDALTEALRYFKRRHGGYVDTKRVVTPAYPKNEARGRVSKTKLGRLLGIPTREDTMALIGYLASVDGRFSESALATAEIHDRDGTRINAVNSGNDTLTLSVLKERAGNSGWHDVVISGRAYEHVQRWLLLTAPLRSHMRKNKLVGWQSLFIYASSPLGKPTFFAKASNINSAFRAFAQHNSTTLGALTEIVTIPRIRSQRGIIVFLKDFDIKAMAKELGNDEETSMRHYLPDAIWNYFAARWIQVFQNLLIVEATRGTPYMARALMFQTATELDEFLKTHALEPMIEPKNKDDGSAADLVSHGSEEKPQEQPKVHELMVAASHEIFVTLLSVKGAVELAFADGQNVHNKALYWYEFTKRLQGHIESDAFSDRGIQKLMKDAAADISPTDYLKAIFA